MLIPANGPIDATAEGLRALYVSLNRPVVTLDGLPVGPAVAAVAVHEGVGATLMVRSTRTGTVAFRRVPGPEDECRDAALSGAESQGFLFEEQAGVGGPGLERHDWPRWLAELFPAGHESPLSGPVASQLSKFRWVPSDPSAADSGGDDPHSQARNPWPVDPRPLGGQEEDRCSEA